MSYDSKETSVVNASEEVSARALESVVDSLSRLEAMVLEYVEGQSVAGSTSDECQAALGLRHQTCSPRFTALKKSGVLIPTEERRRTRSGRKAVVYVTKGNVG